MSHTSKKRALITGITGQDGAYLAQFLLDKGYVVHGMQRRSSSHNTSRIDHLSGLVLHYGDMTDSTALVRLVAEIEPHEIYNLAAQSHVAVSFESPEYTAQADALGTLRLLEAIRLLGLSTVTKFYQASTSELFGKTVNGVQGETTPFYPRSPYAVAKLYAYWIVVNYREAYNIFACNGILFNHESPLRGETFVTRKITRAVARIHTGQYEKLVLGNLDARRDWGYAPDYVRGMWLMLQHTQPEDFVIATGQAHTVREFVECAFSHVGVCITWQGTGVHEQGVDSKTGQVLITIDPRHFRPTDVDSLCGDSSKARRVLGWQPTVTFEKLVEIMMQADMADAEKTWNYHQKYTLLDTRV